MSDKSRSSIWLLVLRVIAILSWLIATIWFLHDRSYEALLAFIGSTAVFLESLRPRDASTGLDLSDKPALTSQKRHRYALLRKVKAFWIDGVLENSLYGAVLLELGMVYKPDAVEYPCSMVLRQRGISDRTLPPDTKILDVFRETEESLLILGEPGAGKTTTMLALARELIASAECDDDQPIPVVLNLSSWSNKQQSLKNWLIDELSIQYDVPERIGRSFIEADELLLLLDGLDEVKPVYRAACVTAINSFHREHGVKLVVCSRTADYETLTTRLTLYGAVILQPLTIQQVDTFLASAGSELSATRVAIDADAALQELAKSPLNLSIIALAYREMTLSDLAPGTLEQRRRHLFEAYIQRMFEHRKTRQLYTSEQTIRWLSWLAHKLSHHYRTVFFIEQMQPDWLPTIAQRRFYSACVLLTILLIALGSYVPVVLVEWLTMSLSSSSRAENMPLIWYIVTSLIALGPYIGIAVGLFNEPQGYLMTIKPVEKLTWSWPRARYGCIVGSPLLGLVTGLTGSEVEKKIAPNQGILRSAQISARIGIIVWLTAALVYTLLFTLLLGIPVIELFAGGLIGTLYLAVAVALAFGGKAVIQHLVLRVMLYKNGAIPWRYARFLDYTAELIFLRKVGGGYIFVHQLLLDHFASLVSQSNIDEELVTPAKAQQHLEQAYVYENSGELENALYECELAIQLVPELAEAHNLQGIIWAELGQRERAISNYREALRLDPTFREAQENLAEAVAEPRKRRGVSRELITIRTFNFSLQAYVANGLLEVNGVQAVVVEESMAKTMGLLLMGGAKLQVRKTDAIQARRILNDVDKMAE